MKLDLSKIVRISVSSTNRKAPVPVAHDFDAEKERRLQRLDDWQDPQPDISGFAFVANPKELDNDLYETVHNYEPDYSDPKLGSVITKTIYETICPKNFIIVPINKECICGQYHK